MPVPQSEFWEAGVVNQTDVKRAESESQVAWSVVVDTENRLSAMLKREQEVSRLITRFDAVRQIRQLCDALRRGLAHGDLAVGFNAGPISSLASRESASPSLGDPDHRRALVVRFFGFWLFRPDDESLSSRLVNSLGKELLLAWDRTCHRSELAKARARFERLESNIRRFSENSGVASIACDPQTGKSCKESRSRNFLAEVFREWGYEVETTKASGDQGSISSFPRPVSETPSRPRDIPARPSGIGAVQEAHTGMRFYRCQRCAVITNSTFTASARKLAAGG